MVLEVNDLLKNFGGLTAVSMVDFTVSEGEIVGLIGPNGAGKTTIFNLITGFTIPSGGQIIYCGEDITGLKPHQISQKAIVRTFQITNLFQNLSVYENVLIGRHLKNNIGFWGSILGFKKKRINEQINDAKILELLSLVKLEDFLKRPVRDLPFGYQNLVQIITALAAEPKLILLDEPSGGLNTEETVQLGDLIKTIRGFGITVILVEHNMRMVMGICDKIVAINYGRKIAEGNPKEIQSNAEIVEAYLGRDEIV